MKLTENNLKNLSKMACVFALQNEFLIKQVFLDVDNTVYLTLESVYCSVRGKLTGILPLKSGQITLMDLQDSLTDVKIGNYNKELASILNLEWD